MSSLRSGFGVTNDDADWQLLALANDRGQFALRLGSNHSDDFLIAFERGIDREWFTLVDLSPLPDGGLMRVFRLTQAGERRRTELQAMFMGAKAD